MLSVRCTTRCAAKHTWCESKRHSVQPLSSILTTQADGTAVALHAGMSVQQPPQETVSTKPTEVALRARPPARKAISKTHINFLLDFALLLTFMVLMWTAVVVHFIFPPGPDTAGWTIWGFDYVQWSSFHFGVICLLAFGILIHVMLHWTWVCNVAAKAMSRGVRRPIDDGTRTLYGVAVLIVILHVVGLGIAAAWLSVQSPIGY